MSIASIVGATVASRDLPASIDFYRRAFEFDILSEDAGETILGATSVPWGWLRLVQAQSDPGLPRPLPWEIGGRVLGIKPREIEASHARLLAEGASPTPVVSYDVAPGATTYEYWVDGPDDVTWEVPLSGRVPSPALEASPARGHGEVMAAALTLESIDDALELLVGAGGMSLKYDGVFDGETFESLFGFPDGAAVRAAIVMGADGGGIILELWEFIRLEPIHGPQRPVGLQRLTFEVDEVDDIEARLSGAGATIVGPGLLTGPGGIEMEMRNR